MKKSAAHFSPDDSTTSNRGIGWFKAIRYPDMPALVRISRTTFLLAYLIAYRARWSQESFNPLNLDIGEAAIDYENWGLTEQEFRTARKNLEKWNLARFRSTRRGTIGKLLDTRLFSTLPGNLGLRPHEQTNGNKTNNQRAGSEQSTTNKEYNNGKSQRIKSTQVWETGKVDPTK
jgi:hypothetical protein